MLAGPSSGHHVEQRRDNPSSAHLRQFQPRRSYLSASYGAFLSQKAARLRRSTFFRIYLAARRVAVTDALHRRKLIQYHPLAILVLHMPEHPAMTPRLATAEPAALGDENVFFPRVIVPLGER